jgi:UDP-glucose 4-epimerase
MLDEFLGLAYLREYNLELVLIRLFNTVSPRQTGQYGMVVPRFVGQAIRKEPITVYGDGLQSRCFCDVSDTVQAIIQLPNYLDVAGQIFNIGSTEEVTILDLAQRVKAMTGNHCDITYIPYYEAYALGF